MKDYELHTKNAWNNYFREITHHLCRKPVKQSFISTIDEIRFIRFKIVQPESAPKQTGQY